MNKFIGFQRLVFSEEFINTVVRRCWEDTREKIFENSLEDVVQMYKDGRKKYNSNGEVSTAPNFIKYLKILYLFEVGEKILIRRIKKNVLME